MASSSFMMEQVSNNAGGSQANIYLRGTTPYVAAGFASATTANIGPTLLSMAVNTVLDPASTMYAVSSPTVPVNNGQTPVWTSNIGPLQGVAMNPAYAPVYSRSVPFPAVNNGLPASVTMNTGHLQNVSANTHLAPTLTLHPAIPTGATITANTGFIGGSSHRTIMNISDMESRSTGTVVYPFLQSNENSDALDLINDRLQAIELSEPRKFKYSDLAQSTEDFCDCYKIGEGGFGSVYRATISGITAAVKLLHKSVDEQFYNELDILVRCKHENLLRLLGYSDDGLKFCLIYEYMPNGSLDARLACDGGSLPLSPLKRFQIAYFSALGLDYLHTFSETPMVHRDVKSANILLDENFVPKIGDFGIVRIGGSSSVSTVAITTNLCGTFVYMAREGFLGDVSVKLDTYSFGVVLLELLTGLPPYDGLREDKSLVTHMEDCEDIVSMLDEKVEWDAEKAILLYEIANKCLTNKKKRRPTIGDILPDFDELFL